MALRGRPALPRRPPTCSPHCVSSEQSPQSHTKLHTVSGGARQWLGTQAPPGDPAASRDRQGSSGVTPSCVPGAVQPMGCPALGSGPGGQGGGWVCGWGLPAKAEPSTAGLRGRLHRTEGPPRGAAPGEGSGSREGGHRQGEVSVMTQTLRFQASRGTGLPPGPLTWGLGLGEHKSRPLPSGAVPGPQGSLWVPPSSAPEPSPTTHPGAGPGQAGGGWAEAWPGRVKRTGRPVLSYPLGPAADSALTGGAPGPAPPWPTRANFQS